MEQSLFKNPIVINPNKDAIIETENADLYQRLDAKFDGFRDHQLVSSYEFKENWPSWEIHPHGDEVIVLLAGSIEFVLLIDGTEHHKKLCNVGDFLIIPRNIWHTAKVQISCKVLFITPGEETQIKNV